MFLVLGAGSTSLLMFEMMLASQYPLVTANNQMRFKNCFNLLAVYSVSLAVALSSSVISKCLMWLIGVEVLTCCLSVYLLNAGSSFS